MSPTARQDNQQLATLQLLNEVPEHRQPCRGSTSLYARTRAPDSRNADTAGTAHRSGDDAKSTRV